MINPLPPRPSTLPLCDPSDPIQIAYLADHTQFVPAVVEAIWNEWKGIYVEYYSMRTLEQAIEEISRDQLNRDQLNSTYVVLIDGQLAGTAQLLTEDTPAGFHYHGTRPWLASLYIFPPFRGRGLVKVLVEALVRRCENWGFESCWLITQHLQQTYKKLAFRTIETCEVYAHEYTVMRRDFARGADGKPKPILTEEDAQAAHKLLHPEQY
ncbi:MAG: GNAT family N-acetyltransferase [Dehalococcoidales bacterium]|nr:GNAT family N-acetyltransferase [Dehalococcoidales bacterium]